MTLVTRCPSCTTAFRVVPPQLRAQGGKVRCGRCLHVFDGFATLALIRAMKSVEPPSSAPPDAAEPDHSDVAHAHEQGIPLPDEPAATPHAGQSAEAEKQAGPAAAPRIQLPAETKPVAVEGALADPPSLSSMRNEVAPNPIQADPAPADTDPGRLPWSRHIAMPWNIANGVLLLALLLQTGHLFRVELATAMPAIRPLLERYCELLGCSIPYPRNAALLSIETSDLQTDAQHIGIMTLHATVHNYASYPQAFPSFDLTLTDAGERPLARHVFDPAGYLEAHTHPSGAIAPGHDLDVKLRFEGDHPDMDGYRIFLFYPEQPSEGFRSAALSFLPILRI
ncbi:DUF3426 domain-containing protein [Nitrosovibrio sp. Nv17]|uniref:DUF3426 domain-containing protein n=1 Tax=Nitrosovibrio sp. Nv17 TaxID=1855339 RepID=UPI0009090F74|nr:DUF3426 domain-containing protein [Nitrosovibrio sp. Nv17]SFW31252.1 MJ0042 family finger-like domain-containing protein [Nitrosovibrio sp. Nv17]